jgi:carbon-monoxide dehydrogenase medium subunit
MKPAPFTYRRAESLASAINMMAAGGDAKYIAGGQTLGPMLNLRISQPDLLIDISGLPELRAVHEETSSVRIGAGTRHAEIEDGKIADPSNGLMRRVARTLAYRAVRNRGTIGGSLAHADPVAEWPTVLLALGATLHLEGTAGWRDMPIGQFLIGNLTTAIESSEILTAVSIPRAAVGTRIGYQKFCHKAGEFAQSLAAVALASGPSASRIVLGSAAGTPILLPNAAGVAASARTYSDGLGQEIRRAVATDVSALGLALDDDDLHLHGTIVARAVKEALLQ